MLTKKQFLMAIVVTSLSVAFAQETTGNMTGRVTDSQGLPVPGATITVTGPQGSQTVTADGQGRFQVNYLVPGTYSVKAELQGFKSVEQANIAVRIAVSVLNVRESPSTISRYKGTSIRLAVVG